MHLNEHVLKNTLKNQSIKNLKQSIIEIWVHYMDKIKTIYILSLMMMRPVQRRYYNLDVYKGVYVELVNEW